MALRSRGRESASGRSTGQSTSNEENQTNLKRRMFDVAYQRLQAFPASVIGRNLIMRNINIGFENLIHTDAPVFRHVYIRLAYVKLQILIEKKDQWLTL